MQPSPAQLVVFGDSLSDAGTFGFRFTTNPGLVWTQLVARHLGGDAEPYLLCDYADAFTGTTHPARIRGGLNYAQGGARVTLPYSQVSDEPWGIPWSAARQIDAFLSGYQRFNAHQVVVLFAGTNDVTYRYDPMIDPALSADLRAGIAAPRQVMDLDVGRIHRAADEAAELVARMRRAHAHKILVFGLYDLAAAPWFQTVAARDYVRTLARAFNDRLRQELASEPADRVRLVDVETFIADLIADPDRRGFSHGANADACAVDGADFCDPVTQRTPTAHRDYVFAAAVHLSTATNELLARHVLDRHLHGWIPGIRASDQTP